MIVKVLGNKTICSSITLRDSSLNCSFAYFFTHSLTIVFMLIAKTKTLIRKNRFMSLNKVQS